MRFPKKLKRKSKEVHDRVMDMVLVCYKKQEGKSKRDSVNRKFKLREVLEENREEDRFSTHNIPPRLSWAKHEAQLSLSESEADELSQVNEVEWIAPVYATRKGKELGALYAPHPRVLMIRLKKELNENQERKLEEILREHNLTEIKEKSKYLKGWKYVMLLNPTAEVAHVYDLRDELGKKIRSYAEEVRFENIPYVKPATFTPNDSLFGDQWNLPQIDAPQAWDITEGHESIVIAILDEGVDLGHPDLNFFSDGIRLDTMSGTGAPTGNHGTPCAGIAAAATDNSRGVAGVAGSCKILPIAFVNWTDVEVAAGIGYAVDQGAHAISMSFGSYDPSDGLLPANWDFDIIDPAIEDAHAAGLILVAATGNEDVNTFNRYPARHELVIAVGASSTDDNRKTTTSPDGENWWGSNFADGVSVVAPGVLIPSTDRLGGSGYDSGDYVPDFNGTSSATPHVAGLVGLVISMNPYLQHTDVRDVIERTADKVGTTSYATVAGFPNGTRNQPMGYGRINTHSAVNEAGNLFVALNELNF